MITLELLRNYNTKSISHRDFPSVQCLTRISLNFLYFTYTHKNQSDAEYFLNYLENLHFSKSINRIDMLLATIRYRDRKNLPTWQRRLLESFKLLNYQLENFTTTEESASFFANIFH